MSCPDAGLSTGLFLFAIVVSVLVGYIVGAMWEAER